MVRGSQSRRAHGPRADQAAGSIPVDADTVGPLMEASAQSEPEINFWGGLQTHDQFGWKWRAAVLDSVGT